MNNNIELTDEEIVTIYRAAQQAQEHTQRDFLECFGIARDNVLKEKELSNKEQQEPVMSTIPQDSISFVQESNYKPIENETKVDMDPATMTEIMRQNFEEIYRLNMEANNIANNLGMHNVGYSAFFSASNGTLTPEYVERLQNRDGNAYKEYYDILLEINTIARKNYYIWCTYSDDATMENAKENNIKMYQVLKENAEKVHQDLDLGNKWNHNEATITIDSEIDKLNNHMENSHYIGASTYSFDHVISSNSEKKFMYPSESYDNTYYLTSLYLTENQYSNFYNKRFFEEGQRKVDSEISSLSQMSVADYRKHRIDLMKLRPEEKALFDSQIRQLIQGKEHENYR